MTTPSSPIGFSDIYSEANGAAPSSATSLAAFTKNHSWFDGPTGFNNVSYYSWGQSYGIDGIYNVQGLSATPIKFDNYRSIPYYYDQTNTQISFQFINNSFPFPPGNDFNVLLKYMDSSLTIEYASAASFMNAGGPPFGPQEISNGSTPLIYGCNYYLEITANPPYAGGVPVRLTINGNNVFGSPQVINSGINTYDYTSFSNEYMTPDWPVTGATGSYALVEIG
jgi:hypothetical protein